MTDTAERERLRGMFDSVAHNYRNARPGYPREVFDLLVDRCGFDSRTRVLEIGAGAGQATIPILLLGSHVTAIEPGPNLIRELLDQAATANVRHNLVAINDTFENATIDEAAFDAVVSATAFHWVDPEVRLVKSAFALRDHGFLIVWSNRYGDPGRPDPFHEAIQPLIKKYAPELISGGDARLARQADEFASAGAPGSSEFEGVEEITLRWEGRHDPRQVRTLFSTFSGWIAVPPERREPLLDELEALASDQFGGVVVRPYRTVLQLRRRKRRT